MEPIRDGYGSIRNNAIMGYGTGPNYPNKGGTLTGMKIASRYCGLWSVDGLLDIKYLFIVLIIVMMMLYHGDGDDIYVLGINA